MTPIEQAAQALREFLAAVEPGAEAGLVHMNTIEGRTTFYERIATVRANARAALASLEAAKQEPLTPMQIDNMVAQTMDRVAKQLGLEHAMHLNSDILVCHTLRRALVQDAYALGAAAPSPGSGT